MAEKNWVYTYSKNGSERTVKFATYDQALARARGDSEWGRAFPLTIDNATLPEEEGFIGTEELAKRITETQKA